MLHLTAPLSFRHFPDGKMGVKSFHDDCWWEVADDYGTSLYSELTMLINEKEDKRKIKELVASKISDWSSHNGRRNLRQLSDLSNHDPLERSTSGRLMYALERSMSMGGLGKRFSSHGDKDKDKESESSELSPSSLHSPDKRKAVSSSPVGAGVSLNVYGLKGLTTIEEKDVKDPEMDLESQDFIPSTKT